ncbi:MAG: hypothetical protein EB055_01315 [Micrococcales bacterium]|nr:hypothetical protein [Micrococcales bacterium]
MKIVRGKLALAIVLILLSIPTYVFTSVWMTNRAFVRCASTPHSEPNSSVYVKFNLGEGTWVCYKTWEATGKTETENLGLIP